MPDPLSHAVTKLLIDAAAAATQPGTARLLADSVRRMQEPLRLAVAGSVKAGKSTLLNSLVGEELAPTDAGECTRIVTWYRWSEHPRVVIHPKGDGPKTRPFTRDGGSLAVDLGPWPAAEIDRMEVWWPSRRLQLLTLIDTPGLASLSSDLSAITHRFLVSEGDRPAAADAVLYLLRHAHSSDLRFLEAFHGDEIAQGAPMNTVGVLSRADEIGSARSDALEVAARVGDRYRTDSRLHRLCPVIVPVAGLVAQAGVTLRENEFRGLAAVAALAPRESTKLLLTADRFVRPSADALLSESERRDLLARFGLFGVRLSVSLIRSDTAPNATALSGELLRRSGIVALENVLAAQFTDRSRVLKSRSGLAVLRSALKNGDFEDGDGLRARLEEVESGAHALVEVRTLNALRTGDLEVAASSYDELDRLLGGSGHDWAARLGIEDQSQGDEIRQRAQSALARWQRRAEHPITGGPERAAARVAIRTLEGLLAELPPSSS